MDKKLALRRKGDSTRFGVLLVGGMVGALAGIGAAYLLLQAREARARDTGADLPILNSSSAAKLGLVLFGLFRQVNEIAHGR
jgi:hypothetical protein